MQPHDQLAKTFFTGANVVVVDKDCEKGRAFRENIEKIGYKTIFLSSAEELIEKFENLAPNLIAAFVDLPGMDGIALCRTVKTNASWDAVPIVLVSNNSDSQNIIKAFDCGADDFISSECSQDEMRARLDKCLKIHSALQSEKTLKSSLSNIVAEAEIALEDFRRSPWNFKNVKSILAQSILLPSHERNPPRILAVREKQASERGVLFQRLDDGSIRETSLSSHCDDCCLCSLNYDSWAYADLRWGNGDDSIIPNDLSGAFQKIKNFAAARTIGGCIAAFDFHDGAGRSDAEALQSAAARIRLNTEISAAVSEAESSWTMLLSLLAGICEPEYANPGAHAHRISMFSAFLASEMGMSSSFVKTIAYSAQLHDLGKIKIPIWLLKKSEPLTVDEFEVIKEHAALGAEMIKGIPRLELAVEIAMSHHERWDGTGYPLGLARNAIPIAARIVSLADIYDALRTERPFREAYNHYDAVEIITAGDWKTSPEQFDPDVLEAFKRVESRFEDVFETSPSVLDE